jgi:hypothetical protein
LSYIPSRHVFVLLPVMSPAVSCHERDQHLKRYHDAVRAYRIAVVGLDATLLSNQFNAAYQSAEEACKTFERVRGELEMHTKTHGCQT